MLQSLKVQNVALIEKLHIEFSDGLNVLTGETGAGKSILVDSLGVILGHRISADLIRYGADELKVEGVFILTHHDRLVEWLKELDIPLDEDKTVIISRKINRAGKNTVLINGWQIPVSVLRSFSENLVQIHAQHDTQAMFSSTFALEALDSINNVVKQQRSLYEKSFQVWKNILREKVELEEEEEGKNERLELVSWQILELLDAELEEKEEEELKNYILEASNVGKISESIGKAYDLLSKDDDSVLINLTKAIKEIMGAAQFATDLENYRVELQNCYYQIEEISYALRGRYDRLEFDPSELNTKQKRMELLHQLKKKYGMDIIDLKAKLQDLQIEKTRLQSSQTFKEELEQRLKTSHLKMTEEGEKLSQVRIKYGKKWEKEIESSIKELAMSEAKFEVLIQEKDEWTSSGHDEVDFLFSANVGQPLLSLKKVASGGELSRVALAIQAVSNQKRTDKTLIFDEIDTGIGGKTALSVGEKMLRLSKKNQILSITHLPQIAVFAENQFNISKSVKLGQTYTEVKELTLSERIDEIARMISGEGDQSAAREMAEEMLRKAHEKAV